MHPFRLMAAAAIASGALALAAPVVAAPKALSADPTASGGVMHVSSRDRDRAAKHELTRDDDWRRDEYRRDEHARWRHDGNRDRHDADRRRSDDERRADRADRRDDDWRRDDWRHEYRDRDRSRWEHGNRHSDSFRPYGWDRGNHYGWGRGHGFSGRQILAYRHPKHSRWVGHKLPRRDYATIDRYRDFDLPRPGRHAYYVRQGDNVYLVERSNRRILDVFVLRDGYAFR